MVDTCTNGVDTGFAALSYAKVAALGVLQGITELLPISSTAHMRLVPAFLGWQDPGSAFSAAMQLAALAAVVSYFWGDVRALTLNSIAALARGQFEDRYVRFAMWIVFATIPIGIAGLLASKLLNTCNSPVRGIIVIGWACVAMALLLGIAEAYARHRRTIGEVHFTDAMLVGLAQVGALIPEDCLPSRWPALRRCGNCTKFILIHTHGRFSPSAWLLRPFQLSLRSGG